MNSEEKLKPTKFQLKQELELSHPSILLAQLDPLVLTHPKSTSSMPSTSPPKLSRVKLKSPRNSEFAPKERKLKLQKQPFLRNSTWNHLSTVWKLPMSTIKDTSSPKKSLTLTPAHLSQDSNKVSKTSLHCPLELDILLRPPSPSSLVTHLKISLPFPLKLGTHPFM